MLTVVMDRLRPCLSGQRVIRIVCQCRRNETNEYSEHGRETFNRSHRARHAPRNSEYPRCFIPICAPLRRARRQGAGASSQRAGTQESSNFYAFTIQLFWVPFFKDPIIVKAKLIL